MSAKIVRLDRAVRPDYDKVVAVLDETDGGPRKRCGLRWSAR